MRIIEYMWRITEYVEPDIKIGNIGELVPIVDEYICDFLEGLEVYNYSYNLDLCDLYANLIVKATHVRIYKCIIHFFEF